ncbi:MAG: recombination protein RecR [Candidatus Omnitrophica bacterium]|nr:recombination protein RecR [Candidatus Omnitrophota bacterium]
MSYPRVIENLIERLMKLPGIGRRSAERIVFWMLNNPREDVFKLSEGIVDLKENLRFCRICNNFAEQDVCTICTDTNRDQHTICVVENPKDAAAIEKTGMFKGQYHVLLGSIAPAEGRGPDDLHLDKLIRRVTEDGMQEVVIATDADMEGELTSLHVIKILKPLGVKVSRIGIGLPAGGAVEFADMSTLAMSFKSRRDVMDIPAKTLDPIANCP